MNEGRRPNALIHETSPYLLQHAYNPVQWYAWNEETLKKAKGEQKLLLISIGYAACHWCHVMEKESFMSEAVAEIMNTHFICIKVDREERPDVDDVYMSACQLVSQRGCGWPLNAIALPDGRPVWATTYHPKPQWMQILLRIAETFEKEPDRMYEAAHQLTQGIAGQDKLIPTSQTDPENGHLQEWMKIFMDGIDDIYGGRKGAPKFPMPNTIECLLKYHAATQDKRAWQLAALTLDKMANGGIYDQLGGGFARYSVDAYWQVPHFEKMLYDNAQLIRMYALAYKKNRQELYLNVMKQSITFVHRELMSPQGTFFSAIDADSEGEEGKFYTWTKKEIFDIVQDEKKAAIYCAYYSISEEGNFEHSNILYLSDANEVVQQFQIDAGILATIVKEVNVLLWSEREKRIRPITDDKVITSWNALMVSGLAMAYEATGQEDWLTMAKTCLDVLWMDRCDQEGKLNRTDKTGLGVNGFLEDYACMIEALLHLYSATYDEAYVKKAHMLVNYVFSHFDSEEQILFYFTSDLDVPLAVRKKEISDNVISSSNSIMVRNLMKMAWLMKEEKWQNRADKMLTAIMTYMEEISSPHFFSNWCAAYIERYKGQGDLEMVGKDINSYAPKFQRLFLPNLYLAATSTTSTLPLFDDKPAAAQTLFYWCVDGSCRLPVEKPDSILKELLIED